MNKRTLNGQTRRTAVFSVVTLLLICACAFCVALFSNNANAEEPVANDPVAKLVTKAGVETQYDDLNAALVACQTGDTVELLKNVELSGEWTPVPNFNGTFDGKNFTITGLQVKNRASDCGLFAMANTDATIQNLTITGAEIAGTGSNAGVLAGCICGSFVSNVKITNSTVNASEAKYVGGMVGHGYPLVYQSEVSNCNITGKDQVGGFIGYLWVGGLRESLAKDNNVEATAERAGGIVGKAQFSDGNTGGSIMGNQTNTVSGGTIKAPDYAGGFAGQIMGDCDAYTIVENTITGVTLDAPEISPVATVRPDQNEKFMNSLAEKVSKNTWDIAEPTTRKVKMQYGANDNKFIETPMQVPVWVEAVCKIGDVKYTSIQSALEAAQSGDTIELIKDVTLEHDATSKCSLNINKEGVTLDGKGFTLSPSLSSDWDVYKASGSASTFGSYNFIKVAANNISLKNITIDIKDYRGLTCATTMGGTNVLYSHVKMTGDGCGHYNGSTGDGWINFNNCDIQTNGYGINFSITSAGADVAINNCVLGGWNSFGTMNSLVINDTAFKTTHDSKDGTMAGFRPYCPTSLYRCTFSPEYAMGDKEAYKYVGVGTGSELDVNFYKCSVEKDSEGKYADIQKIINYKNGFETEAAAQNSKFIFDAGTDQASKLIYGVVQTKTSNSWDCAEGSAAVKVVEATGTTAQSGTGAIYYVGKDAEGSDLKITAGKFSIDPSAYIDDNHIVVNSEDNECPFLVRAKQQEDPSQTIIPSEDVHVDVDESVSEDQQIIAAEAVLKSDVSGVVDAVKTDDSTKAEIRDAAVQAGGVTKEQFESATVIELEVIAHVDVKECTEASEKKGNLVFSVKPVANITTKENGVTTGVAEGIAVDNSWLSGQEIAVTLGCGSIEPAQVAHILDSGDVELFKSGSEASYSAKTFKYDSDSQTVTIKVNQFSLVEVYGTANYASVTYDANGGTGTMDAQGVELNKPTALKGCSFTRDGYTFSTWNTKADGSGVSYNDGDSITVSDASGVTLYAQWTAVSPTPPTPTPTPTPSVDSSSTGTTAYGALQNSNSAQTGDPLAPFTLLALALGGVSVMSLRACRNRR